MEKQILTIQTRIDPFDRDNAKDLISLGFIEDSFDAARIMYNAAINWLAEQATRNQKVPSYADVVKFLRDSINAGTTKAFRALRGLHYFGHILQSAARDAHTAAKNKFNELKAEYIKDKKPDKKVNLLTVEWTYRRDNDEYQSFTLPISSSIKFELINNHTLLLPAGRVNGKNARYTLRVSEDLKYLKRDLEDGYKKVCVVTICKKRDEFFISITFSIEKESPRDRKKKSRQPKNGTKIGIDLGLKTSATTYDGKSIELVQFNPQRAIEAELEASRLQSELSHKARGSKRHRRLENKIAKLHSYAARCRQYSVYCYIKRITSQYKKIIVDSFVMKLVTQSRVKKVRKRAYRSMKYFFEETLDRKTAENGNQVQYLNKTVKGAKFLPTTKTCSKCLKQEFKLTQGGRVYNCTSCNHVMDRDVNAAINTYNFKKLIYIKSRTKKPKKKSKRK